MANKPHVAATCVPRTVTAPVLGSLNHGGFSARAFPIRRFATKAKAQVPTTLGGGGGRLDPLAPDVFPDGSASEALEQDAVVEAAVEEANASPDVFADAAVAEATAAPVVDSSGEEAAARLRLLWPLAPVADVIVVVCLRPPPPDKPLGPDCGSSSYSGAGITPRRDSMPRTSSTSSGVSSRPLF